jgi:hypothetical protein
VRFVLHAVLQRPLRRRGIEAVADARVAGLLDEERAELVVNALVRVDALDRHADLAAVDEGREEDLFGDCLGVDVVENDRRIVATELERQSLH